MDPLRKLLDKIEPNFLKGGKLELLYPLYEAADTFLYTPGDVSKGTVHVRDSNDMKRTMVTVIVALTPCILMALFNTGYQANLALESLGQAAHAGWRGWIYQAVGFSVNSSNPLANFFLGALFFFPIFIVTQIAGGICEVVFSVVRRHEINEGFLVTGMLFPLTLPPNIPLWQVAVGIIFGVVVGKEVFGGTGKNFLNPALTARAFLYFAYPAQISGDAVWTAVDGYTSATALGVGAVSGMEGVQQSFVWWKSFVGLIPGSLGETSTLAALLGAVVLIGSGIGSWRIMLSCLIGFLVTSFTLFYIGSSTNPMFSLAPHWHLVSGGLAFGIVFMATDPVSAAATMTGKWIYGFLIGFMTVLIRVINPAYPEGIMLAILFGNVFAPTIDYYVLKNNIKRREKRLQHA